jgi:hypothetical protein
MARRRTFKVLRGVSRLQIFNRGSFLRRGLVARHLSLLKTPFDGFQDNVALLHSHRLASAPSVLSFFDVADFEGIRAAWHFGEGQEDKRLQNMLNLIEFPLVLVVLTFFALLLSARIGFFYRKKRQHLKGDESHDLDLIVAAVLTLLALIIGFSFSMAINRYDQRKNYEEAEANAIGTEYVRADLLPDADASRVRSQLRDYLDQRVLFYQTRDERELQQINARTAQLQTELWSAAHALPLAQQTPVVALAVSGINDVLNSQGYTQAAWWNRIPVGAWILMVSVAMCSNVLIGYGARRVDEGGIQLIVLPLVLCIAFFLIADIDSPRRGIIRVHPQNLISLAQSLQGHQ